MKRFFAALIIFQFSLQAAPVIPLPDPVATVDGVPVKAAGVRHSWERLISALPDDISPETVSRIFRNFAEKCVWQREIFQMLSEAGIKIDRMTAGKYFDSQRKKYPDIPVKLSPQQLHETLSSPQYQLKSAIHFYLSANNPEEITATGSEVEDFYRSMPEKFRVPGKVNWGIIEISDLKKAEMIRALLQQGSSFDAVARRFSPEGSSGFLPPELKLLASKMKIKEISPVIKTENGWLVAKLRSREQSTILPLKKVYGVIATELEAAKEAAALEKILKKRLAGKKIIYMQILR